MGKSAANKNARENDIMALQEEWERMRELTYTAVVSSSDEASWEQQQQKAVFFEMNADKSWVLSDERVARHHRGHRAAMSIQGHYSSLTALLVCAKNLRLRRHDTWILEREQVRAWDDHGGPFEWLVVVNCSNVESVGSVNAAKEMAKT